MAGDPSLDSRSTASSRPATWRPPSARRWSSSAASSVPQADGTNECAYIAYWHDKKLHSFALSAGGGSNGYEAFYVAMRMMFGQQPSVNTIWFELPGIEDAELPSSTSPG